jgi:hypothetical protein
MLRNFAIMRDHRLRITRTGIAFLWMREFSSEIEAPVDEDSPESRAIRERMQAAWEARRLAREGPPEAPSPQDVGAPAARPRFLSLF